MTPPVPLIDEKVPLAYDFCDPLAIWARDKKMHLDLGKRVRELRQQLGLTQKQLAVQLGASPSYVSKVERNRLHFGDYPSEKFIHKLAEELNADEDELLLLANHVPEAIKKRIRERPDVFLTLADLDDESLNRLLVSIRNAG